MSDHFLKEAKNVAIKLKSPQNIGTFWLMQALCSYWSDEPDTIYNLYAFMAYTWLEKRPQKRAKG